MDVNQKHQKWAVLFDFDGVSVKSMEQHFEAWRQAFAEHGFEIDRDDFFPLEGQGIQVIAHQLGSRYQLNQAQVDQIIDRKISYYNQFMTLEFYDYFFDLLNHLKAERIAMGIVTGGLRSRVSKIVEGHFREFITCLVTVDDVERGKPYPDPFLRAAELMGFKPQQCVVVENAPLGIRGAKTAGMSVIAVKTTLPAEMLSEADHIVDNFREVEQVLFSKIMTDYPGKDS